MINNPLIALLFLLFVFVILPLSLAYTLFRWIDSKIDYSGKGIRYFYHEEQGNTFARFPYWIWQKNKLKNIEQRYSQLIEINSQSYTVLVIYRQQKNRQRALFFLPAMIYKDFVIKIEPRKAGQQIINLNDNRVLNNVTNNTQNIFVLDDNSSEGITYEDISG